LLEFRKSAGKQMIGCGFARQMQLQEVTRQIIAAQMTDAVHAQGGCVVAVDRGSAKTTPHISTSYMSRCVPTITIPNHLSREQHAA